MKKLIKRGMRKYTQRTNIGYYNGMENEQLKFYSVFETKREFSESQFFENIVSDEVSLGLHFHMFITSPNDYPWVSYGSLIHQIFEELSSLKHKKLCISKYGYFKIDELEDRFVQYHTKQFVRPNKEMILTNHTPS